MTKRWKVVHQDDFNKRLRTKLTVTLLASWMVITLGLGMMFYQYAVNMVKQQAAADRRIILSQLDYNLTNYTRLMEKNTQQLTLLEGSTRLMAGQLTSDVDIYMRSNDVFSQVESWFQSYDAASVYYYSVSGTVLGVSHNSHRIQLHCPEASELAEAYLAMLNEQHKSVLWLGSLSAKDDFFFNGGNDTPYITLLRVNNVQGKSASVILINITEESFRNIYYQADGERFSRYVMDEQGRIVSGYSLQSDTTGNQVVRACQPLEEIGWTLVDEYLITDLGKGAAQLLPYMVSLLLAAMAAAVIVSVGWIRGLTKPLEKLRITTNHLEKGELGMTLDDKTTRELGALGRQFNAMSMGLVRLMKQKELIEEERRQYQMAALRAQINPHFLYNTLNTIRWMSMIAKTDNITECISALRDILYSIFRREGDYCTLQEELVYIGNFLTIMNYRFGRTIHTQMDVQQGLESVEIIRFVLQPILENSITHGSRQDGTPLDILLHAYAEEERLVIDVIDNGKGIPADKLVRLKKMLTDTDMEPDKASDRHGIGVLNVHKRIRLCCGPAYGLQISSHDGSTCTKLVMPINLRHTQERQEKKNGIDS